MIGMAIALLVTLALVYSHSKNVLPILGGMAVGGAIGAIVARRVQMTQMPELVAAMHSLVGLAAVFIAVAAVNNPQAMGLHVPDHAAATSSSSSSAPSSARSRSRAR